LEQFFSLEDISDCSTDFSAFQNPLSNKVHSSSRLCTSSPLCYSPISFPNNSPVTSSSIEPDSTHSSFISTAFISSSSETTLKLEHTSNLEPPENQEKEPLVENQELKPALEAPLQSPQHKGKPPPLIRISDIYYKYPKQKYWTPWRDFYIGKFFSTLYIYLIIPSINFSSL
jgi:hypothetical protein